MKKHFHIAGIACLLLLGGCTESSQVTDDVCINDVCFGVEVADDSQERQKGLMYRKVMPEDEGMLFIFERSWPYTFWMKNTYISLDILWIDENKKIIHIEKDVPPCKNDPCPNYGTKLASLFVLELNAGTTDKYSIQVGDYCEFKMNSE